VRSSAFLVAAALLAPGVAHGAQPRCREGTTVLRGSIVTLYKHHHRLWACRDGQRRQTQIAEADPVFSRWSDPLVAGAWAAAVSDRVVTHCDETYLVAVNVATGEFRAYPSGPLRPFDDVVVCTGVGSPPERLLLRPDGVLAAVVPVDDRGDLGVFAYRAGKAIALQERGAVDPTSLELDGLDVRWTAAGVQHTAKVPGVPVRFGTLAVTRLLLRVPARGFRSYLEIDDPGGRPLRRVRVPAAGTRLRLRVGDYTIRSFQRVCHGGCDEDHLGPRAQFCKARGHVGPAGTSASIAIDFTRRHCAARI
jgi:hypothetical protein